MEVRFYLDEFAVRITYWIATGRRIALLTVFHRTLPVPPVRNRARTAG
jgi:hypothetical protein